MTLTELNNNTELATRYIAAWTKIAKNVQNVLIEYNAHISDDVAEKLRADLATTLEPYSVLEYIVLEDAVYYLENIANNAEDCYFLAKEALDAAVSKYDDILKYIDDYKTINLSKVNDYARHQFEQFLNYEMKKIHWSFEDEN